MRASNIADLAERHHLPRRDRQPCALCPVLASLDEPHERSGLLLEDRDRHPGQIIALAERPRTAAAVLAVQTTTTRTS
jgi:hypothetical protein